MNLLKISASFILGIVVGAVAVGAIGYFWIGPAVARDKFDFGYGMGELNAQIQLGTKIPDVLGRDVDPHEPMVPFFSAKTESVIVVTRHGVKTLRLCCDGSEPLPAE
jgi:hypothetical protein